MNSTRVFLWLFLIFGLSICIKVSSSKEIRVVCYYTNWSVYRPGTAKFSPQNINPYLCTHLIYAFGGFTKENTLKPFDKYQDMEKGGYAKFTGLKTYNKDLKTLLAIGGWNEASSRFSPMVASADRRKQLVKNAIKFLRQNNFDGLDLDWEYPAFREGGKPRDKENYAKLVQELREEFERESEKTGRTRLLLTMAVPAGIEYINKGYDIPKLTKYLDWMNILSYDYHSAFEPAVNHHAPLYPLREATEYDYDAELNIDYTIKHYLELGADPGKLVMGIPTYGRSYTLFNPDASAIGDPADGPGEMGEATRENGYLAYYEICENVKSNEWTVVQPNDKAMGPYAYKENQWVGYDDENIARKKAEYVAENGLGGIMFWAIDNDDFRGSCHGKPYPLIEAAKEALIAASGLPDDNLISPPSKPTKLKSRLRNRPKTTLEPSTEKSESAPRSSSSRRRNRLKSKSNNRASESDVKSKSRRNEAKKTETASTYSSLKVITPAYTTPEPPSTPDQGGAFKCEDEGFFPHPKDCKKYFWCLSGPGELGIVAHQFTCPAGLYFNKAADSCDYSQNVLCNKKLSKTTSTTEGKKSVPTTTEAVSTKAPTKKSTTTTTTTEAEVYDDDYEYEDEENSDTKSDAEEDPKVIKELLDLIKKAGGIEELEKQLNIGHDEVKQGATTPSTRTKSLVEKFLTSRNNKNSSGGNKYVNINRNSRGPQNAGIDREEETVRKTEKKPQYTTISRKRPTSENQSDEDGEVDEDVVEKSVSPKYTSIRRSKEKSTPDYGQSVDRNKILGEEDRDTEDSNRREVTVHTTPQYVNIRRQRPTTVDDSSTSKYISLRRSTTAEATKEEEKQESTTSRYISLRRSTTRTPEAAKEEEKQESTTSRYVYLRRSTTLEPLIEELQEELTTARTEATESPVADRHTSTLIYQTVNRERTSTTGFSSTSSSATVAKSSSIVDYPTTTLNLLSSKSTEVDTSSTTEVSQDPTLSSYPSTPSSSTSTAKPIVQTTKSPVIFEPRPFSVEEKSTISTTYKPVRSNIRSTTSPIKVSDPNVRSRFRRPFQNKFVNSNKVEGVSDNSVESESVESTLRPLRSKSRFSKPDIAQIEDARVSSKPSFRQRARPFTTSSTERILNDREQDEIQRKYRPLSIDDLSSLTAADIAIQKGTREGGFRRTRIRTTTTESPKDEKVPTTRRRTLERSRITSTARIINPVSLTENEQRTTDRKSIEIRAKNRPSTLEITTVPGNPIVEATTVNRRVFNRNRTHLVQNVSTEISNDLNDQVKSGSDEIKFSNENVSSSPSTAFTRRPPKRMRKVLRRLKTSTSSPSTAEVTHRGKPLSYASLNLEVITTSERSPSISDILVVDTDSNEANISDESIEEDENIKLSATNIRENSDVNNNNAIFDIGFTKLKKADVVFDKTSYGNKNPIVTTTPSTESSSGSSFPRTRKIIRRLKPTESTISTSEPEKVESKYERKLQTKPNRGRKIIRRLKPTLETITEKNGLLDNREPLIRKSIAPQFFEKRLPNPSFKRRTVRPSYGSYSNVGLNNRFSSVEEKDETLLSKEEFDQDKTTQRGTLRYKDIIRTTARNDGRESETENDINKSFYFTTPHHTTLYDDLEETSVAFGETTSSPDDELTENEDTINEATENSANTNDFFTSTDGTTQTIHTVEIETVQPTVRNIFSVETTTISIDSKKKDNTSVPTEEINNRVSTSSPDYDTTISLGENESTTESDTLETTTLSTTTTEYIRKSTLRSSRLRPTYQIRRLTTALPAGSSKEVKSERTPKFFTRKKPSFRLKSTTESTTSESRSTEKPRRRYPFTKYGRLSTTEASSDPDHSVETSSAIEEGSSTTEKSLPSGETASTEHSISDKLKYSRHFGKSTTETYQTEVESSDTAEKQKLRNKSLFSKKRKMNIPIHSSSEVKEEPTTEHPTTLYHVFAEPEINENITDNSSENETQINTRDRIEPLVEINRIIEVHIKNSRDNSSGVNEEAKGIFDKIGAINRVTSIKVVDGNGTEIADLPLDQTSQRLAVVHDIIAQEKENEALSSQRKDRKFDVNIVNNRNNELTDTIQRPEIIDGKSHIKIITPKSILAAETSTIALEALFTTTDRNKAAEDKSSTNFPENELLDTEYSRFVNIRIVKPVGGRSIDDETLADTPMVVKIISHDEDVTMKAKVVEVTPKNLDQTIKIAPIQVAMARTIADTPIVGIKSLNEKISQTPFALPQILV